VELVKVRPAVNRPEKPVVSVCIANYQGEFLLTDCLDSVLQQEVDFDFEVIVHDDASTDGSVDLLADKYPQVEVLISSDNVGFCVANNRMVKHASGYFLLLLNNDAVLLKDALSTLLAAARTESNSGVLTLPQYDWFDGKLVDRGCRLDPFYNPVPNHDPTRSDVAMAIGACLWVPRQEWSRIGGFPEWLESIGEDLYLCCAARLAGLHVKAVSSSGYRHRQGHSFGGNRPQEGRLVTTLRRRALSERNKTFALFVMTPTVIVWPLLFLHLMVLSAEGATLALIRRDRILWRDVYGQVFAALWRFRGLLLRERKTRQMARQVSFASYVRGFTLVPRKLTMLMKFGIPDVRH
jgi:GT2 family glycosyltransferase